MVAGHGGRAAGGAFEYFTKLARRDFLSDSPRALYSVESFAWDAAGERWERAGLGEWTDSVGDQPWGTYAQSAYMAAPQQAYTVEGPYETGRLLAGAGVHAQQDK